MAFETRLLRDVFACMTASHRSLNSIDDMRERKARTYCILNAQEAFRIFIKSFSY